MYAIETIWDIVLEKYVTSIRIDEEEEVINFLNQNKSYGVCLVMDKGGQTSYFLEKGVL